MISRLAARVVVAQIVILLAIFALTAPIQARTNSKLLGIVTLDSPVAAGSISIFNGSDLLQAEPSRPFANGTFDIGLDPKVAALLPNTDLRVVVEVDAPDVNSSPVTLSAVLHDFDPDSQVVFINPVTTIVSAYLDDNPDATLEEAAAKVEGVLGVSTSTTLESTHMLDFDSKAFIAASQTRGGFDAYAHEIERLADKGEVANYAKGPAVPQATVSKALGSARKKGTKGGAEADTDFLHFITALGRGIAKDAFANSNTAGELGGWIIETISGKLTPTQEDQLDKVSKKLDKITTQIDQLRKELTKDIADLKDTVTKAQNYIVYQQVASATNPAIVSLNGMRKRLYFLAVAGAAGEAHPELAADLSRDIFSNASDDLETIQNGLAGINQTPGLISQWIKVMLDENPNLRTPFPVFFTNEYLTSATAQYQFYLGAQFIGFDLRLEYAHTLKEGSVLAKQVINDAIESFDSNFNANMKLVAANSHASIGGRNYYPSIALPADDLVADSRSGLVWLNHAPCSAANQSQPCNFALRQNARGNIGYPLANEFLQDFSDGGVKFSLPSTGEWNNLVAPLPLTNADYLGWLNQRGFRLSGQLDSAFPDEPGPPYTNSYWTSDTVSFRPPSVLYPDTINWFFDVKRQGNQLFVLFAGPGSTVHLFPPPAARILPRAFDLNLLYQEDPHVLGKAVTQP